ncbi:MAG: hypothetical protein NC489_35540, partial [Ruminococcus flavefaciens]|nr:hypothetical protein [Ruminococcus flavefaciens]
ALFEQSKAKNILKGLPKKLRQFNFRIEAIPDVIPQINKEVINAIKKNVIENNDFVVSENVSRWIERFGNCYDVLKDAEQILKTLVAELESYDKELLDILHIIELEPPKDLYGGWMIYKAIRENRKERRMIKDETLILNNVLEKINPECLNRDRVKRAVDGLVGRKYRFRFVEEEETESVM